MVGCQHVVWDPWMRSNVRGKSERRPGGRGRANPTYLPTRYGTTSEVLSFLYSNRSVYIRDQPFVFRIKTFTRELQVPSFDAKALVRLDVLLFSPRFLFFPSPLPPRRVFPSPPPPLDPDYIMPRGQQGRAARKVMDNGHIHPRPQRPSTRFAPSPPLPSRHARIHMK